MAVATLHLDIVSAEAEIFSGEALRVYATGTMGELEVTPGHTPLLTGLLPGFIRIRDKDNKEDVV
ncbi:MAG TPA: F0F1 ATP synthase subunit epsilon, partial [Candidatus Berkiella sp.]|nr:F0F1 ATP synthase subunit epsilon [Candidatus Berkiella sp.]